MRAITHSHERTSKGVAIDFAADLYQSPGSKKLELTTAKILGVLALLIPNVPFKIKEFAYFGFGITLLSASIAHFARGDARLSVLFIIDPLFFLALLIVSYVYLEKSHSFSARQIRD
jgi:DoxX-like protein